MSEKRAQIGAFLLWIAANLLGWLVLVALLAVLPALKSIRSMFVLPILIGVPMGLAQWLVLRRLVRLSPLWVLAFPVGWLLSSHVPVAIPGSLWQIADPESVITLTVLINRSEFWSYTVVVLVYGLATGAILWWLLTQRAQILNRRLSAA